jgi:hypothetical protein
MSVRDEDKDKLTKGFSPYTYATHGFAQAQEEREKKAHQSGYRSVSEERRVRKARHEQPVQAEVKVTIDESRVDPDVDFDIHGGDPEMDKNGHPVWQQLKYTFVKVTGPDTLKEFLKENYPTVKRLEIHVRIEAGSRRHSINASILKVLSMIFPLASTCDIGLKLRPDDGSDFGDTDGLRDTYLQWLMSKVSDDPAIRNCRMITDTDEVWGLGERWQFITWQLRANDPPGIPSRTTPSACKSHLHMSPLRHVLIPDIPSQGQPCRKQAQSHLHRQVMHPDKCCPHQLPR